jgi:hypothetical protein
VSGFAVAAEVKVKDTGSDEVVVYPVIAEPLIAPAMYGIETVEALVPVTVPIVGVAGAEGVRVEIGAENADKSEFPPAYASVFPFAACATL